MSAAIHPFDHQHTAGHSPRLVRVFIYTILTLALLLFLPSCAGHSALPPSPPPAQEVLVPVVKPCEVAKVEPSELTTAKGVPHDIYEAVKRLLADRAVLLADRDKLLAANGNPCHN